MRDPGALKRRLIEHRLRIAEVLMAAGALAVTIIFASFAGLQWLTMTAQLEVQRQQIAAVRAQQELSERPWVVVTSIYFEEEPAGGKPTVVHVDIVNSGRTPANNCRVRSVLDKGPVVLVKALGRIADESVITIPPGAPFESLSGPIANIDAPLMEAVTKKQMFLYLNGEITYDVPGGQGKTTYCSVYDPLRKRFIAHSAGNYAK